MPQENNETGLCEMPSNTDHDRINQVYLLK